MSKSKCLRMLALFFVLSLIAETPALIAQEVGSRPAEKSILDSAASLENVKIVSANAGRGHLDRAVDLNLIGRDITTISRVIRLTKQGMEKGLTDGDRSFAIDLLASSALQRAKLRHNEILQANHEDKKAKQLQKKTLDDLELAISLNPKLSEGFLLIAKLSLETKPKMAKWALDKSLELAQNLEVRHEAYAMRAILQDSIDMKIFDLNQAIHVSSLIVELRQKDLDRGFNCPQIFDTPQIR